MAHYNKFNKIEMEILRDGEVIGYNYYFFKKDKDNTIVTNQLKFTVKLFGATIFEVESYGEEKYIKDKLISFTFFEVSLLPNAFSPFTEINSSMLMTLVCLSFPFSFTNTIST